MRGNIFFIFMGLLTFSCSGNAQILKPVSISYFNENNQQNSSVQPVLIMERMGLYSDHKMVPITNNFKCTLPKGAIFCRMEDAIYNHLNFWLKFRMGTDDRYSN